MRDFIQFTEWTTYKLAVSINLCWNLKDQSMKLTKLLRFVMIFSSTFTILGKETYGTCVLIDLICIFHHQLRIIIKPKTCVGVGPLCAPQQVELLEPKTISDLCCMYSEIFYLFLIIVLSADLLPCSWVGSWNLDSYSSFCAFTIFSYWLFILHICRSIIY